jgi:hypothetical protein
VLKGMVKKLHDFETSKPWITEEEKKDTLDKVKETDEWLEDILKK